MLSLFLLTDQHDHIIHIIYLSLDAQPGGIDPERTDNLQHLFP